MGMASEYSVQVIRKLEEGFRGCALHRPMRIARYEPGAGLAYDVTGVGQTGTARVHLVIEDFVGGGFAGQVYRVKILSIEAGEEPIEGLEVGRVYAMKILVPPSSFSRLFRNLLYWVGFQGPFQLQVNPAAARAGAIWQKLIRRGAKIRFGDENKVTDIYATFVDGRLGSCGELSEWIDGRTWQLEVDDHLDSLKRRDKAGESATGGLGSPEYRAKLKFMRDFVKLLNDMGAYEFARQYEWWTCMSQPNCLKRRDTEDNPSGGLVAVDFRAGLALLPFLPMSPGDFKLILKGLFRGSLVQFDRGSISKLDAFARANSEQFADSQKLLDELKAVENVYRNSVPDIAHNHVRLFYSKKLWSTILDSAVTGWKVRNLVDESCEQKMRSSKASTILFYVIGVVPFLGKLIRRIWARPDWRSHYAAMLTSTDYLRHAVRGRMIEKVILWHRAGRIDGERAPKVAASWMRFLLHCPLSFLPAGLHRFLTDRVFFKDKLHYIFVRPIKLYFSAKLREQWMRDMVSDGQKKHILTDEDAQTILSRIQEPYIQKYLKSLAVHVCTLPVTQIVSVLVAWIYTRTHPELTAAQTTGAVAAILVLFQITPISPGSLVRGFYVLYLVIRERNFKDYNIAVFLGFFKYIGYLAFPIQMSYRYPALARFMAVHWSTEAVHIVPVFGEHGALLEHWVFRLFYNWPLTIRRRMRKRAEMRASIKPRYWYVGLWAVIAAFGLASVDYNYLQNVGNTPGLRDIWYLAALVPLACGALVTLGCGGAKLWKRFVASTICGIALGLLYTLASALLVKKMPIGDISAGCVWPVFVFAIVSTIGAIITELKLPEPKTENTVERFNG
ncbi:MAG: hypothetical protein WBC22_10560 [Sedimentisphaerales bacterium]